MSELPRYHKGKMGPVQFSDLNDVYERLDRLQQVAESVQTSIKQKSTRRTDSFLVQATRGDGEHDDKYIWREIIMQQDDTLLTESDDEFVERSQRKQYRSGQILDDKGMLTDNYATSITPDYPGGIAICHVVYPITPDDGGGITAKYLLSPVQNQLGPGNQFNGDWVGFFKIKGTPQSVNFNNLVGSENETINMIKYPVHRLQPSFTLNPDNIPVIAFVESQNPDQFVYDTLWRPDRLAFENVPDFTGGTPGLTRRPLDIDSIVTANYWYDRTENSGGSWWMSKMPLFDVNCDG